MTLLTEPTRLVLRKIWQPMDPDAAAYIAAVETADGQALEEKTKIAIDNFVLGCKADGIWSAIKACCILAGARTLAGALVPLAGTAPTNFNFVDGDYNRKTGLVGNGSTKYLNSNRNNNADPQNSKHVASYLGIALSSSAAVEDLGPSMAMEGNNTGVSRIAITSAGLLSVRANGNTAAIVSAAGFTAGLKGVSRASDSTIDVRANGVTTSVSSVSETRANGNLHVFGRANPAIDNYFSGRLAFYSIGESLNLALLDARVTDLINAFGAAIP